MEITVSVRNEQNTEIWSMEIDRPGSASQPQIIALLIGAPLKRTPQPRVKRIARDRFELPLVATAPVVQIQLLSFSESLRLDVKGCTGSHMPGAQSVVAIYTADGHASVVIHNRTGPALAHCP